MSGWRSRFGRSGAAAKPQPTDGNRGTTADRRSLPVMPPEPDPGASDASPAPTPRLHDRSFVTEQFDAAVRRARATREPTGADPDYDLVADHFDYECYLLQELARDDAHGDPVRRFLDAGADARFNPDVNFSVRRYLRRHPKRRNGAVHPYVAWLREGRAAGELGDPAPRLPDLARALGTRPAPLTVALGEYRADLADRLRHGVLGEMIAEAAEIEPLVGTVWPETTRPTINPFVDDISADTVAMHRLLEAVGDAPELVLLVNRPRWGGGRRIEGHLTHALADRIDPSAMLVIHTECGGESPAGRYPQGVREIDLPSYVDGLDRPRVLRIFAELLRALGAGAVLNINSRTCYEAVEEYGAELTGPLRLFHVLFTNERRPIGNWVGYPMRYYPRQADLVAGAITDSHYLREWLVDTYALGPRHADRITVLPAPVDDTLPLVAGRPRPAGARPAVYWAGRWDRQKRVDLVLEIARRMPGVDFRMWGEVVTETVETMRSVPTNVSLEGKYAHLTELDLGAADAWLYTSEWDGVPGQLLEVGMTGVPIVGVLVGGTGEVLSETDAWPVAEADDPEAYVGALQEVIADPTAARARAASLRARLLRERTVEAYAELAGALLLGTEEITDVC